MSDEFKKWLDTAAADSGKKIEDSDVFSGIVTQNFLKSPLCALQLGYAIILDKPILLIVDESMKIPKSLAKVAKAIEKVRLGNQSDMARAVKTIQRMSQEIHDGHQ